MATAPVEIREVELGIPKTNLLLRVCRNAAAQLAGKNVISLGRLIVASSIARIYGKEAFGEYSLILVMLAIAESMLDFGTSDVFVREICHNPAQGLNLLRRLTGLKIVQTVAACAGFLLLIVALQYPAEILRAALFASASLVFFAGVLIYHTLFKANLAIELEVAAEFVSVLLMIAAVRGAAPYSHTIGTIFACHMVSRAAFFVLCYLFGRSRFRLSIKGITWTDLSWGFRSSAAIGLIGLIVVAYESIDVILLSRLGSLSDVAYYSGAQRYIAPIVLALSGIGSTLYPVAASYWPGNWGDFATCCRKGMDAAFAMAAMAACGLLAGADFLMRLLGPNLAAGATILRVLALVLFVKAITTTLGPVLYVVRAQNHALGMVTGALIVKGSLICLLVPRFGYVGAAFAAVATDTATALLTLLLLHRACGLRIHVSVPLKVLAIAIGAAFVPRLLVATTSIVAPLIAVALFVPFCFLTGAVKLDEVRPLLRRQIP